MRRLRAVLALGGATVFALAGAALPSTASAVTAADPPAPKRLFSMKDERIQESSGLAKSVKHQGVYWTVNDSGDTGRVFAVDTTGEVKAVLRFGAKVNDVEALGIDKAGTLYIADIGDNKENREQIEIYTIPEPDALEDEANVKYHRYDFTYPDGAHDAETLLIEPGTGQLYIVTKATKGTGTIYAAPPSPSRQGTNDLTKLAAAPSGVITDGTFLPDGQRVVLRTYADVTTVAWGDTPNAIARGAAPLGQGETVALGPTDGTVVVGSEGANSAVYQVQVPAKAAASTPPKASATPKPATAPENNSSEDGKGNNLRWIIVGAALFALIITIVTFPPGRRERQDRQAENARLTGQSPPTPHRRQHS
ncbi:hypothetical protein [Kribbella sp. HUAS MG21]|uniref:Esterase-like activity of phytase family protein n=1 Tax=Kribbella sp. HUAS MG21 TaxID=3160966 RepID=A0AAU7TNP9_9ACTN